MFNHHRVMPELLEEIADVAGVEAVEALVREYGGTQVTIPSKVNDGHWLVKLLGMEAAEAIVKHFTVAPVGVGGRPVGMKNVVIPTYNGGRFDNVANEVRKEALRLLSHGGHTRSVARQLRVHERTVFRWKALWKKEGLL